MTKTKKKTLIAVFASNDSIVKNNELARVFEYLYDTDKKKKIDDFYAEHNELAHVFEHLFDAGKERKLSCFHFIFIRDTFNCLILGVGKHVEKDKTKYPINAENQRRFVYPIREDVRDFLLNPDNEGPNITVLPGYREGGLTILANLIVQRQCSIIWPFLSPIKPHWIHPENLALMRLSDLWKAKRLMNSASVKAWFHDEAKKDVKRNPQGIPIKVVLGTTCDTSSWPEAKAQREHDIAYYEIRLPSREMRSKRFWRKFDTQSIALIAHDDMKSRMLDFAIEYENELSKFKRILSTGTTGLEVINACRRLRETDKVIRCLSGPKGGDIEIATEILFNRCHIVVFFIDPLHPHPHIDDIRVVFSACMGEIVNNNVRMLTNQVQAWEWMEEAVRGKNT
jgi:methylglyoxal synthase